MKRLLFLFIAFIACTKMIFAGSGTCGTNLTWTLTDSVLTISGSGAMTNYESRSDQPWYSSCNAIRTVVISQGVSTIGDYAFAYCSNITSVTIPNSVTSIGIWAFHSCSKLKKISIPNSVTTIGTVAFGHSGLTSITIPNSITRIKKSTFTHCSSLSSVSLPNTITVIEQGAFGSCDHLTSITIPNSVTTIVDYAFSECTRLQTLIIGSNVTSIGCNAFKAGILNPITCYAVTPPTLGGASWGYADNTFYNVSNPSGKSLFVPAASVSNYKKAATWKEFNVQALPTYTITWKQDDGSTIDQTNVEQGTTPTHANPTKASTAQYTYTFKGWTPTVVAVTANATYTATYTSTVRNYAIKFTSYDGTVLQNTQVSYGSTPAYEGATPTKPATAQYTYSFNGWDPEIVAVTGNATYTAQFDSVVNNYTISFNNYNGAELQSSSVAYGSTPEYNGEAPTKSATEKYTYTFKGWDPEITAVTGNATYTAQFDSTLIEYEIDTNPGSEPIEGGSVHIDGTPNYGETITLTPIEEDGYVFVEWSDGNNDNPREIVVEGNIAIYPIFHKCEEIIFNIAHTIYKGSSYSFGGKELTVKGLYYDTIPLANGCDSVVELKLSVVKAPNFTLRVVVNDETMGTVTGTGSYKAGTSVTITATPASSKYIFVRWYNEDENIDVYENPYTFTLNRNLQLRAVFRKAPRKAPKSTNQTK